MINDYMVLIFQHSEIYSITMDHVSKAGTEVEITVKERDGGGELKYSRDYKLNELTEYDKRLYGSNSSKQFVSNILATEQYSGSYYYKQDQLHSLLAHQSRLQTGSVEALRSFCYKVLPSSGEVPTLADIAAKNVIIGQCKTTFPIFKKQHLEGKVPENLIEHLHDTYKIQSLRSGNNEEHFREHILADELGVTQSSLDKHLPDLLHMALIDFEEDNKKWKYSVPTEVQHVFSLENIRKNNCK